MKILRCAREWQASKLFLVSFSFNDLQWGKIITILTTLCPSPERRRIPLLD